MNKSGSFNQRSVRRFFIRPTRQIKLIMAMLGVSILMTALLLGFLILKIQQVVFVLQGSHPEAAVFVQTNISPALDIMIAGQIVLWISSFGVGILVSHRIYGPIVPMVRHIRNLAGGDYSSRVNLRGGDDFGEVANALNDLAEKLGSKGTDSKS